MKLFTMLPVLFLSLCGAFLLPAECRAEPAVKTGEKIAFLGDSITQGGANNASGYVRLVISGLEANGIKATMIPAGILKAFGFSDAELKTADDFWLNAPNTCEVGGKTKLTLRQYEQLRQLAAARGSSVGNLMQDETAKAIDTLLKTAP
jgi:hypothetical protein